MRKLIVFIVILNVSFLDAQITHGKVKYGISLERLHNEAPESIKKYPQTKAQFEEEDEVAENLFLELAFVDNKSSFKTLKSLSVGNRNSAKALIELLAAKGVYFTDLNKKTQILQTKYGREQHNIQNEIGEIDWTLTKETKKIGDFVCYKAIYKKKILDAYHEVMAWYAPSVPLSFGPKEYAGSLPGLIMELDEPSINYRCVSIEINPNKKIQIDWPETKNIITEAQYKKEGDKAYKKIKKIN